MRTLVFYEHPFSYFILLPRTVATRFYGVVFRFSLLPDPGGDILNLYGIFLFTENRLIRIRTGVRDFVYISHIFSFPERFCIKRTTKILFIQLANIVLHI